MKGCEGICNITMFNEESYKTLFNNKKNYEDGHDDKKVKSVLEYTKTKEYMEKNFSREAVVINPLKACQPLGAFYAAIGFENTLPYLHGSQGCAAYFRSHFSRHFKEPFPAVSDSMTEDAAVFGGHKNIYEGLKNSYKLYKPEIIGMCTSCMAEVIGDDISSFVNNAKSQGDIPKDVDVVTAHTPSFVGSHITGYDNMLYEFIKYFGDELSAKHEKINVFLGFDTYVGDFTEIKRIFSLFGVEYTIISDPSEMLNSPADGNYKMFRGGTKIEELKKAPGAKGAIFLQTYSMSKTIQHVKNQWGQVARIINPIGLKGFDDLLVAISELTGKEIPEELKSERGKFVDAITDSYYHVYGKRFAVTGDPDIAYGLTRFILELGGEPVHILVTNANKKFTKEMNKLLEEFSKEDSCKVYPEKDMWHLRSLMFVEPVDYLIGNTFTKLVARDTDTPLIRIGFPIFDRHHLHRYPVIGYQGGINLLNWIVNGILEDIDNKTKDSSNFDIVR
ncbi:MAG: nitrogenase molybdenum-iron protein beta chain [Deferribacteres bacterium]|jgi:nitrogenase molybdenum-iron protein beta chain|nr:Mo-nitrogenase MoFe protein subunit NifK [Deferribacteraceae bacterium]MDK2792231.1 nitrogenase molybdenum-iron protein beta chain [Deferribacteres bacterium]